MYGWLILETTTETAPSSGVVRQGKAPPCKMASLDFLIELEETGRVIGRGAYGEVLELLLHGTKVAEKKINCKDREIDIKSRIEQQCNRLATQ